jgi:hypothetical protein
MHACKKSQWLSGAYVLIWQQPDNTFNDLTFLAGIAQLVEQLICNQQVVGSNPTAGSITIPFSSVDC